MRIITFQVDGQRHWGALQNDQAVDLNMAHALYLASRGREPAYLANDVLELIQRGEATWNAARDTLDWLGDRTLEGVTFPLSRVRLLAPIPRPPDIIAIGRNYKEHAQEGKAPIPTKPVLFAKLSSCVIGPGEPIHAHAEETQRADYEGELGVVIARTPRRVSASEALDYVFGYTIVNDVSARDLQHSPEAQGQWTRGKSLASFCPMGPAIVTRDQVPDPQNLPIRTLLNGQVMQDSNTSRMIFDVAHLIEFISHGIRMEPGTIISSGTPEGVGDHRKPPIYLKPDDVIEIEVGHLGKLSNPVQE